MSRFKCKLPRRLATPRRRALWIPVWPDGTIVTDGPGRPAAFFTRRDARCFLYNQNLRTPKLRRFSTRTLTAKFSGVMLKASQ